MDALKLHRWREGWHGGGGPGREAAGPQDGAARPWLTTRRTRRKVGFIIAGAQKAGTSALDACLRKHPAICMAQCKETHFFDDDARFAGNAPDYGAYHACFEPSDSRMLLGEATPVYMYWHDAPRRIWQYNPAMKLLAVLRNPIERAYSSWNMERARGAETLGFGAAIRSEPERCRAALPAQHRVYSYVDRGFYTAQLRRLWACFPRHQTLILRYEEFARDPAPVLDRICDFLGVARLPGLAVETVHATPYVAPMAPEDWRYLRDAYEFEVRALERLLGWDCGDWLREPRPVSS